MAAFRCLFTVFPRREKAALGCFSRSSVTGSPPGPPWPQFIPAAPAGPGATGSCRVNVARRTESRWAAQTLLSPQPPRIAKSCPTLCDLMDCSMPDFPVPHHLLEFPQVHVRCIGDAIQPFHPLSPSSPSALNLSQHRDLFHPQLPFFFFSFLILDKITYPLPISLCKEDLGKTRSQEDITVLNIYVPNCRTSQNMKQKLIELTIHHDQVGFILGYKVKNTIIRRSMKVIHHINIKKDYLYDYLLNIRKASLSFTISWSLFKFMSIESVMPPNHLILCLLHSICQQIWKTQQWSQDWKRSVFIPIPKKGNAKERSSYRTIALISHASKSILKEISPGYSLEGLIKGTEATVEEALSPVISENTSEVEDSEKLSQVSSMVYMGYYISHRSSLSLSLPEDTSSFRPVYRGASTAFCIQLFFIDEKYEARSLDFMNFVFHLFHDKDFCVISVPHLTPEFVLIQSFVKVVPFSNCTLDQDLYVFHRAGLLKTIKIRLATLSDTPGVEKLVSTLMPSKSILEDLKQYNEARRDPDGTPLQVFVAEVAEQVVGIAVIRNEMLSYALNHTNRKLSLEPKITINAKIVVVGASNVGISFLETLVFCHCYNDRDHELMSLCSWVNVVVGRMTAIDRAAKQVIVSREKVVLYDHLILCTGRQYQGSSQGPGDAGRGDGAQVPCPTEVDISLHPTNREVSNSCLRRYTGPIPCNHFTLNDEEDCLRALAWIKNKSITAEGNVIIYGNSIDTYTTVETLLNLGIRGSCIHLVQHPPTSIITCINDCAVEGAIEEALQAAGVTVYRDALLAQWNNGLYPDPIHTASFTTPTKPFQLPCSMFFSFLEKNVDYETFKAFNDACLVYDGRLVIDSNFHTNDIAIRAAGPLTKFSNRYYSNEWTHSNFNSKEIGFQLAAVMLKLFDPTLEPVTEPPADLDRLIPMYKGAKIKGGILPGSYHYLHVSKPAIPTPLEVQRAQSDFGSEIVTGNVKNGNYFRIHINKYKMVETITCLSKVPFPASNYIRLFGQHEQALNNLCARYEDGLVPDLY
ncbi:hypothetical protein FD755_005144, partial [Muntiacus reevesi]